MIRHYLASALANIARTPFTTAANILTLALGLACFIAAFGITIYWTSADEFREHADRIFLVEQSASETDRNRMLSSPAVGHYLASEFPGVEHVARVYGVSDTAISSGDRKNSLTAAYVEPSFFDLFDFKFLAGDAAAFTIDARAVVLTKDAAERLFGEQAALGQTVVVGDDWEGTVAGVIDAVQQPSFMGADADSTLRFDMLASWAMAPGGIARDAERIWTTDNTRTFVMLAAEEEVDRLDERLFDFLKTHRPPTTDATEPSTIQAIPLKEIVTSKVDGSVSPGGGGALSATWALVGLGSLILVVACANYANLTTAQSVARSKETGMRRVVGASRAHVMTQSWVESGMLTTVALVLALATVLLLSPFLARWLQADLTFAFTSGTTFWVVLCLIATVVAAVAGAYPALVLSRIPPSQALRSGASGASINLVGRVLVAGQFASASFLLLLLTVMLLQRDHLEQSALAPRQAPLAVLSDLELVSFGPEALEAALAGRPGIEGITFADRTLWTTEPAELAYQRSPETGSAAYPAITSWVGHDYFATMNHQIVAGRPFDRTRGTERYALFRSGPNGLSITRPLPIIIDRAYAESLGFSSPDAAIGTVVYPSDSAARTFNRAGLSFEVIGVAEYDLTNLRASRAQGHAFQYYPLAPYGDHLHPIIRLDENQLPAAVKTIESAWTQLSPNTLANIRFFDDLFAEAYAQFSRLGQAFLVLASASLAIATLGLLGIAVHAASRRRHEIAVRKTLGSSVAGIVRLLLTDFSIPVLTGNLLAWPLGYAAAQAYLASFAHRIDLTLAPFFASMLITMIIAWAAVLGVVLKAASVRPAAVLRHG